MHTNVVNFVLVTVLAATLLSRTGSLVVGSLAAAGMVAIAWSQPERFESIAQILPTYAVIVTVLWLRGGTD
ncbi:MAG: hypothetical protein GY711_08830 [bacterium]|nr:hypothetical protein [bacterium]